MVSGLFANLSNYAIKHRVRCRIVVMRSHLRGSQKSDMFSSPELRDRLDANQGLYPPHTDKATVTGTGTRQPSSCGKGPKAVG